MRRFLTIILILAVVFTYSFIPVNAAVIDGNATITVTPSITSVKAGTEPIEVTYTVTVTPPEGKSVGAFQFYLSAPEGMTLATEMTDEETGIEGYMVNASLYYHKTYSKNGIFETFDYTPESGAFIASGTTESRNMTNASTVLTIKATIEAGKTGSYILGVNDYEVAFDGDDKYTTTLNVTSVNVYSELSDEQSIGGIDAPAVGETLASDVAETDKYKGEITWNPEDGSAKPVTEYTAEIVLTAKEGYKFANGATGSVNGAPDGTTVTDNAVSDDGSTLSFKVKFPKTGKAPKSEIPEAPTAADVSYTDASVTVTPTSGIEYAVSSESTADGIDESAWSAAGKFEGLNADTTYFVFSRYAETDTTAASEASEPLEIKTYKTASENVSISGLTAPSKNGTPDNSVSAGDIADATVTWYDGSSKVTGKFLGGKAYTVQIDLKAKNNNCFSEGFAVEGYKVTKTSATSVTLTKTFEKTADRVLSGLEITADPSKTSYTDGDSVDTTGMVVKATYDDGTVDDNFTGYSIEKVNKGDKKVTVTAGEVSAETEEILSVQGKTASINDFEYTEPAGLVFDGSDLKNSVIAAVVEPDSELGYGEVSYVIKKNDSQIDIVIDAGDYEVYVSTAEGDHYKALELTKLGKFTVAQQDISNIAIITLDGTLTYTAIEQTQAIKSVKAKINKIDADVTYNVSGNTGTNAGEYKLTVTGTGNFKGTAEKTWTISPCEAEITPTEGQNKTFGENDSTLAYTTNLSETLAAAFGTPDVLKRAEGENAGTYAISLKDDADVANFTLKLSATPKVFTINAKSIENVTVSEIEAQEYTGNAITPEPIVKDGDVDLVKGKDYELSYSNNTDLGADATVIITGKGNYAETKQCMFEIVNRVLANHCTIDDISDETYNMEAHTPAPVVKDGGRTLISGTDYTVSYENNTNVGTATVKISGIGNYSGEMTKNFNITVRNIANATIADITSLTYDGKAKTPTPEVTDGTVALTKDQDYTVSYEKNTNAGTATIKISGMGNYSGELTKDFTINKAEINVSGLIWDHTDNFTFTYDHAEHKVSLTEVPSTIEIFYTNSAKTSAGEYTATAAATAKDDDNYVVTGTITPLKWKIEPKVLTDEMITITDPEYTGSAITPEIVLKDGDYTLAAGTDYTVSNLANNIEVGTDTASLKVTGSGNYTGELTKKFSVTTRQLNLHANIADIAAFTYDGNAKQPEVTVTDEAHGILVHGTDYIVAYSNNIKAGTAKVTVTGIGGYANSIEKEFTINKAEINVSDLSWDYPDTFTYDQTEHAVALKVVPATVDIFYENTAKTSAGEYTATATATVKDSDNYAITGTIKPLKWKINPKKISADMVTVNGTYVYTGSAVKPAIEVKDGETSLSVNSDFTVSYSNNVNAGTATVTVSGTGNYTGTLSKEFTITRADITPSVNVSGWTYGSTAKTPSVTGNSGNGAVTYKYKVKEADDSTYTETKPSAAGTYTVKAEIAQTANYNAESATAEFTIAPKTLTVNWTNTSFKYNGTAQKPEASLTGVVNPDTVDVTVSGAQTDAGTHTATASITDKNYVLSENTKTKEFTISKAKVDVTGLTVTAKTYDGTTEAAVDTSGAQFALQEGYEVAGGITDLGISAYGTYASRNVGTEIDVTVTPTATGANAGNYELVVPALKGDISAKQIDVTWDEPSYEYTGKAIAPKASAATGISGETVKVTVTVEKTGEGGQTNIEAVNVGNYKAKASITDKNYMLNSATAEKEFAITKGTYGNQTASAAAKFGTEGKYDLSALIVEGGTAGTLSVTDNDGILVTDSASLDSGVIAYSLADDESKAGKSATITTTVTSSNYNDYEITVTVTAESKAVPEITADDITVSYNGKAIAASKITGNAKYGEETIKGTWSWASDTAVTNVADSGPKTVVFTPDDTENYVPVTANINVKINPAVPTAFDVTYDKVTEAGRTLDDVKLQVKTGEGLLTGTVGFNETGSTEIKQGTAYKYTFTPSDPNYAPVEKSITLWAASAPVVPGGGGVPADNLKEAKTQAASDINDAVAGEYNANAKAAVDQIIKDAEKAIESAKSQADIDKAVNEAKTAIQNVPTKADAEKAVKDLKDSVTAEYSETDKATVEQILKDAEKAISEAKTKDEVAKAVSDAQAAIQEVPVQGGNDVAEKVGSIELKLNGSKTEDGKIRFQFGEKSQVKLQEIQDMGYQLDFYYYKATEKDAEDSDYTFMSHKIKNPGDYLTPTKGEVGTVYYYKAEIKVLDKDGNEVATIKLDQIDCGFAKWTGEVGKIAATANLKLNGAKTNNGKVKFTFGPRAQEKLKAIEDMGYQLDFYYYKATSKDAADSEYKFMSHRIKHYNSSMIPTKGTKGTMYYYKAEVKILDENGKLITTIGLDQVDYGYARRTGNTIK